MIWNTMPDSPQLARKKVGKNTSRASETVVLIQPMKKFPRSVMIIRTAYVLVAEMIVQAKDLCIHWTVTKTAILLLELAIVLISILLFHPNIIQNP